MSEGSELRVSDEQRDRAAAEVREHYAAGRLTDDELSDRLEAIYRARTEEELRALRKDLPVLPTTQRAELAERRSQLQRRLIQQTGSAMVPFVVCVGIWIAAGASGAFWPIWVALFALIPLVRNGWDLYGPAPDHDRVDRDLAARERRSAQERAAGGRRSARWDDRRGGSRRGGRRRL
jgi:Domain of unknown function (DUF1707)